MIDIRRLWPVLAIAAASVVCASALGVEALDVVSRETIRGTWQGLAKEYQVTVRLVVSAGGTNALAIAGLDDPAIHVFTIDGLDVDGRGSVDVSGLSSARLRIDLKGTGRAAEESGLLHCTITVTRDKTILDSFNVDLIKSEDLFARAANASRRVSDALKKTQSDRKGSR